jgi:hypothetical protein
MVWKKPFTGWSVADLTLEEALKQKQANPTRNVIGWNGLDCVGKLRPAEVASLHPTLQNAWEEDFKPQPEKPLMLIATIAGYIGDHSAIDIGQYFLWPIYALPILMRVDSYHGAVSSG